MELNELVTRTKAALRVSTTDADIDAEVTDLVNEALEELHRSIRFVDNDDPLILQAVKSYAKAHYGYDEDADKWLTRFEQIKSKLGTYGPYGS